MSNITMSCCCCCCSPPSGPAGLGCRFTAENRMAG